MKLDDEQLELERERMHRGIRALWRDFAADLPEGAERNGYKAVAGDRFAGIEIELPNGVYHVVGSGWLLTIYGRRFAAAAPARDLTAKVILVPPEEPAPSGPKQEDDHGRQAKARAFSGIPENGQVKVHQVKTP